MSKFPQSEQADATFLQNSFPTTLGQLTLVEQVTKKAFPDGIALAMEIKTSWVDASTLTDATRHVTIQAMVPSYTKPTPPVVAPETWTLNPVPEIKTLALVGIHVVGSVKGHPELVWATFEHVDNAPDKAYSYTTNAAPPVNQPGPYSATGSWIFTETGFDGADLTAVAENQNVVSGNIVGNAPSLVSSADVVRLNPWGDLPSTSTAAGGTARIANATDLVSLNNSVMRALAKVGDVRANYFQVGAIWTQHGEIPVSGQPLPPFEGSLNLAKVTMETYHQFDPQGSTTASCFGCHQYFPLAGVTVAPGGTVVSHTFAGFAPLPN